MTVSELIKELKKHPKDAPVYWQDHDHSEYEYNNSVDCVYAVDTDENDEPSRYGGDLKNVGIVVMLRP